MTSGPALRADCERCFALCCVAPAFLASADFAISKKAGQECPNLLPEFRCGIHGRLRPRGFPGCAVYDCFGAGQQVAQVTFGGQDWRAAPDLAAPMFAAFAVMRQLHELLWYLTQALDLTPARPVHAELRRALAQTERLTQSRPERLGQLDVAAHRGQVSILLRRASELARAGTRRWDAEFSGADLVGHDLRNADLNGASLRGAHLTGADLSGADLAAADVTGADLRGADLSGAALAETIFLTQAQLDAARGDPGTTIPGPLRRPSHWTGRTHGRRLAGREGSLAPARELRSYSLGMSGEAWLAKRGDDLGAAAEVRASHQDRDQVVELLRVAAGDGRLTAEELDQRLEVALTARTHGELAALLTDLPEGPGFALARPAAEPKDVVRFDCRSGHIKRDGPWLVPRRAEVRVTSGRVRLDFTEAVITAAGLQIDAEVSSGELQLVTRPGIVVDADDVAIRSGEVKIRAPWDPGTPVLLRVSVSGRVGSGRIKAGPPRRTFWQWLMRRPRPYALTAS